jgi:hypothetical protein
MSSSNTFTFNLRSLVEKEILNRANFIDWYRNLRIILRKKKIEYVLIEPYPEDLPTGSTVADHRAYEKRCNDALNVSCLMLATMSPNLQKQFEYVDVCTMMYRLCGIF